MMGMTDERPTRKGRISAEEWANALTHGMGLLLAIAGGVVACVQAVWSGSPLRIVTISVFVATLILVYLASTVFHSVADPIRKRRWRTVDHCCIYGLIAGTYTPVVLVGLGGAWGWSLFGTIWGLAIAGVVMKLWIPAERTNRFERFDTLLYLAMAWIALVAIVPICMSFSTAALTWMVLGGVLYSAGCIFFLWESLPFNHAIWHGFVLGGSACHFFLVLLHVLPVEA